MSTYDKHEANRFAEAAAAAGQEFLEARQKILADAAARGLPYVDGEGLAALLEAGQKVRLKLTMEHGKIYQEERGRIYELQDFDLKALVEQKRIVNLLLRNSYRRYEEAVQHQLREKEISHEELVAEWTGVLASVELLHLQMRVSLQQYSNYIRSQVLALKLLLDEQKIDLGLLVHLTRVTINEQAQIAVDQYETSLAYQVLQVEMANLREVTSSHITTVLTEMVQKFINYATRIVTRLYGE
jgi:hypothetical protein